MTKSAIKHILFQTLLVLILAVFTSGCSNATEPQLRVETFFDIEMVSGQVISYTGPDETQLIEGPTTLTLVFNDSKLFMGESGEQTQIRPLKHFPSQYPNDAKIAQLMGIYPSVNRIDELLSGATHPENLNVWFEAYLTWFSERKQLSLAAKLDYENDSRQDRTMVAEEIAQVRFQNSSLVVPGSLSVFQAPESNAGRDIVFTYEGADSDENGIAIQTVVRLREFPEEIPPLPLIISREHALAIHHLIYLEFDSKEPLIIELGSGLQINRAGR